MPDITKSYQWAIQTCNADNIGYSQDYRNEQTVNGITYYDCSSFIWYALLEGGFDVKKYHLSDLPFTTTGMHNVLLQLGFKEVTVTGAWLPGDILVRNNDYGNHTEMVYNGRVTMGAKSATYELEKQVSISLTDSMPATWDKCYRYGKGSTGGYSWVVYDTDEAGKMTEEEQKNNVHIIYSILYSQYGWTKESIAGALGSMQIESYFNPGQWELGHKTEVTNGYGYGYGYGLIQWTRPDPSYPNPYFYYCYENNVNRLDGAEQLKYINTGITNSHLWGWITTSTYPETFSDYIQSTKSPDYLASVWLHNLERPPENDPTEATRKEWAEYWYNFIKDLEPLLPNPGEVAKRIKRSYNFILFNRRKRLMQ